LEPDASAFFLVTTRQNSIEKFLAAASAKTARNTNGDENGTDPHQPKHLTEVTRPEVPHNRDENIVACSQKVAFPKLSRNFDRERVSKELPSSMGCIAYA